MSPSVRLGTRGSPLALWQTEYVRQLLTRRYPGLECEIVVITTTGDKMLDTPLPVIGGKGVFTAELEQALRERSVDLAVHSLKDLPTAMAPGLAIGAVIERADPADALVSRDGRGVNALPQRASVGTSSSRRAAQLLSARPDLRIIDLRGNAGTRLRKALDPAGPYDAVVMARAALERLGRIELITEVLSEELMLPAPGQGAIAVQCRDEKDARELVAEIGHVPTEWETTAERAFLEGLGGGCAVPVAARAWLEGDGRLSIRGRVLSTDGSTKVEMELTGPILTLIDGGRVARDLGFALASEALSRGAAELLDTTAGEAPA